MSEGDTGALILLGFLAWNILAFVGFKLWLLLLKRVCNWKLTEQFANKNLPAVCQ